MEKALEKMDIFNISKRMAQSEEDMRLVQIPRSRIRGTMIRSASDPSIFTRLNTPGTSVTTMSSASLALPTTAGRTPSSASSTHLFAQEAEKVWPNYADDYINCFKPFAPFSIFLGRLPFSYVKDPMTGIYTITIPRNLTIIYYITSAFILLLSMNYWINGLSFLLDYPSLIGSGVSSNDTKAGRGEETFLFYRNAPILFVYGMALLHLNVSSLQTIIQAKFIASYAGFSANSLNLIKLPACKNLPTQVFYTFLSFTTLLLGLLILSFSRISPIGAGGPGLLGILSARIFDSRIFIDKVHVYEGLRVWMSIIFIYILLISKVYPTLFIIQTKMMRSLFHLWNQRLDCVLNRAPTKLSMEYSARTSFKELYDDHNLIIQLLRGADIVFQESIDSYFFSMVFGTSADLYFFWRSASGYEYDEGRRGDLLAAALILIINGMFYAMCLTSMMKLAEEAMEGFDAVRRRSFMGNKSEEELYFLFSLYVSYSGHAPMTVVASGYCVYDNNFVFATLGNVAVFFVIMYQVSLPIALPESHESYQFVVDQELLLDQLEGPPLQGRGTVATF